MYHVAGAAWTNKATSILLKSYEEKLEMLETPKKKTRIWIAIADSLKEHNIDVSLITYHYYKCMVIKFFFQNVLLCKCLVKFWVIFQVTPDQVRWKINALAKKYKQCLDNGQHNKFKYFSTMDNIYAQYNVDCDSYNLHNPDLTDYKKNIRKCQTDYHSDNVTYSLKSAQESRVLTELRKRRLARRIESERSQSKMNLERQWLEYLKRQELQTKWRDDVFENHLKLKKEELELRKKELEIKEALELQKLEMQDKDQEEMLQIEKEKCKLLKMIVLK